ncbi:MAG: glycosyltransferase, partial [Rhodoglobus sp.]
MPAPGISVALCTRNGERFLAQQLESILGQTRAVDEVVVSDDASTDGTVALVRAAFAEHVHAPSLTILENPVALGVTRNFEQAIAACSYDII